MFPDLQTVPAIQIGTSRLDLFIWRLKSRSDALSDFPRFANVMLHRDATTPFYVYPSIAGGFIFFIPFHRALSRAPALSCHAVTRTSANYPATKPAVRLVLVQHKAPQQQQQPNTRP